jgi:hypothetical protein
VRRKRWLLALVVLGVATSIGLLLVLPCSSSNGYCGSAAFPRYNRDSPHADERWCGDNSYDSRRSAATWFLVGSLAVLGGAAALRKDLTHR